MKKLSPSHFSHCLLLGLSVISAGQAALAQTQTQTQNQVEQGSARVQPAAAPTFKPATTPVTAPATTSPQTGTRVAPAPLPLPSGSVGNGVFGPADLKREALDRIAPLTEVEVLELRRTLEKRSQAMEEPLNIVAKPVRRVVPLDLSPGVSPEIVRTVYGQGSVITFLDAAGRPWPVTTADNFSPALFDVNLFGTNGLSVAVKKTNSRVNGSVAVLLEGLNLPVSIALSQNQPEVDYSVEFQIKKYLPGQGAPVGAVSNKPVLGVGELMDYLLGTPPKTAKALTVNNTTAKAWQITDQKMIFKTDAMVASPAWSRRQSSSAGVTVYELPISAVVLVSLNGALESVQVTGFSATKEQK
jgi:intracellular multiplication protein IcmK